MKNLKNATAKISEADKAFRLAQSKATMRKRKADADSKLSESAKSRFKNAKKAWKQARKQAKRSAKLATFSEKNLLTLTKHLQRMKKKLGLLPVKSAKSKPAQKKPRKEKGKIKTVVKPIQPQTDQSVSTITTAPTPSAETGVA